MGFNNTIAVISDRSELIEKISAKLVLLRDLDKVTNSSYANAFNLVKNTLPNTVIIHCNTDDKRTIGLIREIRNDEILKNIPVLLLADNCKKDTVIDAFDAGITDVVSNPVTDHELLIRTIWCIQRNELNTNIETQKDFLKKIGIIQSDTGVYTQKFCDEFIQSQLNNTQKYKTSACLMALAPDAKYPNYKNPKEFLEVIKKSVRINDSIAIKDMDEFYIFLPKTKLNGAYPLFERINNNLGVDCGANAAVIEITNQSLADIKELLDGALKKAKQETNSLIVAQGAYLNSIDTNYQAPQEALNEPSSEQIHNTVTENKNVKLFRNAYKQKCTVVIEPVFKKYRSLINSKNKDVEADFRINTDRTAFVILKEEASASLSIAYNGYHKIKIDTRIVQGDATKSSNSATVDFLQLNFQKLSQIIEELYGEFINITDKKED